MDNYIYILAGLPELAVNFDGDGFDYVRVRDSIAELLSEKDLAMVAFLEEGFNEDTLGADFYARAAQSKNRFLRAYFDFDARLRNLKVAYLAKRLGKDGDAYLVQMPEKEFEEEPRIRAILENPDFVQREQQMDELRWEKVNDLSRMDYFNLDAILAFLVKARIVQRWAELDKVKGEEMFRKLVKEVRETKDSL